MSIFLFYQKIFKFKILKICSVWIIVLQVSIIFPIFVLSVKIILVRNVLLKIEIFQKVVTV
jgi:hypothetical protein